MSAENGIGTLDAPLEVVALAKTDGEDVVELTTAEIGQQAGQSAQAPDQDSLWTPGDCIPPPERLHLLQLLTDTSSPRGTSLGSLVRNTVGLGWDVDVWPHKSATDKESEIADARERIDAAARRDRRLDRPSFSSLIEAVKRDQKEIGNGYIEVTRNRRTGEIDGLFFVPGARVRRRWGRVGYVMGQNADSVEGDPIRTDYLNFGEKVVYDANGRPTNRLDTKFFAKANLRPLWKTNELIAFREYTPRSRDYGLPRDYNLVVEYAAARFVNEWTSSFFEGSGAPPKMVFVQGQEERGSNQSRVRFTVPQATMRRIHQGLKADAQPGDRVVVIPVPPGTQVQEVDLGELSDRDLTFSEFKKMHARHVGAALGPLSPIFYGDVDDAGRYTAEVQRSITLEQVFDPDQRETEDRLWNTVFLDLGLDDLRLKFKRLAVEGDAVRRESANNLSERGAIEVGELRTAHGLGPLDETVHGAGANRRLVNTGLPRGAEDRVGVAATEDQRGLRPGLAGRVAKDGEHDHGVEHVEEAADDLAKELAEYGPAAAGESGDDD